MTSSESARVGRSSSTSSWKNGYWALFKCPLCGSTNYVKVRVRKPNGHWYATEFYECVHCTVMFRDPASFTKCQVDSSNTDRTPVGAHTWKPPEQ
jgi:ribosomal protein S27E